GGRLIPPRGPLPADRGQSRRCAAWGEALGRPRRSPQRHGGNSIVELWPHPVYRPRALGQDPWRGDPIPFRKGGFGNCFAAGDTVGSPGSTSVTTWYPLLNEPRSEEHTSELQSLTNLVCRLLLEKKK